MTKLFTLDGAVTDATLPKFTSLESVEASIRALPGLRAWWDPTTPAYYAASGGKVSALLDRSGNGFDALQATGVNQPNLIANGWGTLNGVVRDALGFDGTDLFLKTAGNVYDGTGLWTLVSFFTSNILTANVPQSANTGTLAAYPSNAILTSANQNLISTSSSNHARELTFLSINYPGSGNTTQYLESSNGPSPTTNSVASVAMIPNGPAVIGAFGNGRTTKFNGQIGEQIVLKADLNSVAGAWATLRAYFAFKYRLT